MKLDDLIKKEKELILYLGEIRGDIKKAKLEIISKEYGVEVGSIVKRGNKKYRVARIDHSFARPWIYANPQKKDKSFGIALRNLYSDWEVIQK